MEGVSSRRSHCMHALNCTDGQLMSVPGTAAAAEQHRREEEINVGGGSSISELWRIHIPVETGFIMAIAIAITITIAITVIVIVLVIGMKLIGLILL